MEKGKELYKGKAKTVYATDDPRYLVMHYRDDVSAFDGAKLAQLPQKGETNNKINAYVMGRLTDAGIPTHFVRVLNERESLVRAMKMIPVECVVRNVCAGSMAKRYGIAEGLKLPEPIFEFFYKSDELHDPLCNDDHVRVLGWATADDIAQMRKLTHAVNAVLKPMFANGGMDLVDYKLEFGHPHRRSARTADAGRRVHARRLPAVGREDWREARQGPLPSRSRRRDRALSRSGAAHRRAVVSVSAWWSARASAGADSWLRHCVRTRTRPGAPRHPLRPAAGARYRGAGARGRTRMLHHKRAAPCPSAAFSNGNHSAT